jgi:alkanesulfonate monooxygenase SsuD/methylene tetrahydromethanopterin reductase-like flavin-dependent oxidoreductase (luciferase family)
VTLPDRNQPVEAFFFDRPDEAFRVRVRIWRALWDEHNVDTGIPQSTSHVAAPLPIPIADQEVRRVHRTSIGHRQRAHDLLP